MKKLLDFIKIEKYIFKRAPISGVITILYALIMGIIPSTLAYATERMIRASSFSAVRVDFFIVIFIFLLQMIFQGLFSVANNAGIFERINLKLREELCISKSQCEILYFEDSSFLNKLEEFKETIANEEVPMVHMVFIQQVTQVTALVSASILLISYHPILLIPAVLTAIPIFINRILKQKDLFQMKEYNAIFARTSKRYRSYVTKLEFVQDLRLHDRYDFVEDKWQENHHKKAKELESYHKPRNREHAIFSFLKTLGILIGIILVIYWTRTDRIALSYAAAAMIAFQSLQNAASTFFDSLGNVFIYTSRSTELLRHLQGKQTIKQKHSSTVSKPNHFLEVSDLNFSYPGAEHAVFLDLSFALKQNERVAVVGYNGSGKSTLAKLLLGLYQVEEGNIGYAKADDFVYIPQNIPRLKISVREFLLMGLESQNPSDAELKKSLEKSGLDLSLDSLLGREFSGIELSGGQWQRLAMAKARLFQDRKFYVFDEATSSIDPIEESFVLEELLRMTNNKTSLIITHKLAICPHVEKVLVLKDGKIEAFAPHEEALKNSQTYGELFQKQKELYV